MAAVKARTQCDSIVINIPSYFGVKDWVEFFIIQKNNGVITMIQKTENPQDGEFYTPNVNIDYMPTEREIADL